MTVDLVPTITFGMFFDRDPVLAALDRGKLRYLRRAGGTTRRIARNSVKRKGKARRKPSKTHDAQGRPTKAFQRWLLEVRERPASPPGSPPFTHGGLFRDAILFGLEKESENTVIGLMADGPDGIDDIGELHEFGGTRKGKRYPARPTMGPALQKVIPKLPEFWRNAVS